MADKSAPYERFGPFILFKRIERDALSDLWRAGRIAGTTIDQFFAVRRFTGGDQGALRKSANRAGAIIDQLSSSAVVRQQMIDVADGVPFVAWEYAGGRTLNHILTAAKGNSTNPPNPIPIDQCLAISEKLAFSLETTSNLKLDGRRLVHGCLLPHLAWISEDGDIRVAGQQLGDGVVASLRHPAIAQELAGYFAPEIRTSREATPSSEVYSVGAALFALITGDPPPDPLSASAFDSIVRSATVMVSGEPLPSEIRSIIDKSLTLDPANRFPNAGAIREALANLTHGDRYAPTTFNLAFYIHNLLREEMEEETKKRSFESGIDPTPFLEPPKPRVADVPASFRQAEVHDAEEQGKKKSRLPLVAAIVAILIAAGASGYYFLFMNKGSAQPDAPEQISQAAPQTAAPTRPPVSEPIVSALPDSGGEPEAVVQETAADPETAARQKLIDDEIARRLQEEMMKLQTDYDRKLKAAEDRARQGTTPAEPDSGQPKAMSPAESLDQSRVAEKTEPKPAPSTAEPKQPETKEATPPTATEKAAPAPQTPIPTAPQKPVVREGDLVEVAEVDSPPRLLKSTPPAYPPLAARQKAEATIILSALVSETGKVLDVRVLRGDSRKLGFDDAAIAAVRSSVYEPAVKDGKKVRTWLPVPVIFRPTR